jgi:hypothetical protein
MFFTIMFTPVTGGYFFRPDRDGSFTVVAAGWLG